MLEKNRAIIDGAARVAGDIDASAVIIAASLHEERDLLKRTLGNGVRVLTTAGGITRHAPEDGEVLVLPEVRLRRRGRAKIALLEAIAAGYLEAGQRVIVVSGNETSVGLELDTIAVIELDHDEDFLDGENDAPLSALRKVADPAAFDAVLNLCVELGREGKEGKSAGMLITLGEDARVIEHSQPLVLNPFEGHPEERRNVLTAAARRALVEFSGMDGAFVLRSDGVIMAAGRYLQDISEVRVPSGLGARHRAAAAISAVTGCIAFVVSESTGDTRVFGGGRLLMTIEKND
ncbi:MAG: DNA integrity scanning protein DisA nucleotide-binding domain protein [Gemmatimonadota bacterium]